MNTTSSTVLVRKMISRRSSLLKLSYVLLKGTNIKRASIFSTEEVTLFIVNMSLALVVAIVLPYDLSMEVVASKINIVIRSICALTTEINNLSKNSDKAPVALRFCPTQAPSSSQSVYRESRILLRS